MKVLSFLTLLFYLSLKPIQSFITLLIPLLLDQHFSSFIFNFENGRFVGCLLNQIDLVCPACVDKAEQTDISIYCQEVISDMMEMHSLNKYNIDTLQQLSAFLHNSLYISRSNNYAIAVLITILLIFLIIPQELLNN